MSSPAPFTLRFAELRDVAPIVQLIRELAEFETLTHLLQVTPEKLRPHLFGEKPVAEVVLAFDGDTPAGYALWFRTYSTFLARPGLYLEDLFVYPEFRKRGLGRQLLAHLARIAVERGYGRMEWMVLDWNENAIRFYRSLGASMVEGWELCRVTGDGLRSLAERAS